MAILKQPAPPHYPATYASFPSNNSLLSPPQVTTYEGFYAKFEGRFVLGEARWPEAHQVRRISHFNGNDDR